MVQSFPRGLAITAVAAKDLAKRKRFGAQGTYEDSYPYLSFFFQGRRKFTIVAVKGGVKPEWHQTIKYGTIQEASSKEESTLTVVCKHEKTGVTVGSGDGLIGTCEIDLKQLLFSSDTGVYDDWFQLTYDGKDSGQVHLRLALCDPFDQVDKPENAPLRPDNKNRIVKSKSEKKAEKQTGNDPRLTPTPSTAPTSSSALHGHSISSGAKLSPPTAVPSSTAGQLQHRNSGAQRTLSNGRIYRPRSMADLKDQKPSVKFQEPSQLRLGSKSMEEVRDMIAEAREAGEKQEYTDELASISSPKQTFTLQDSQGNINQLNLLIAPFDPTWLEPTPPTLRRALSAHFYYDDLQRQQASNSRELFPRPQSQQSHIGYPSQPPYVNNDQQQQQEQQQQLYSRYPETNGLHHHHQQHHQQQQQQQAMNMPLPDHHVHKQQQQTHPLGPASMPPNIPNNQAYPMSNQSMMTTTAQQQWSPQPQGSVSYQPHTVFQPRQSQRSKMSLSNSSKHMSLPARYQSPASEMQHLQNIGANAYQSGMVTSMPDPYTQSGQGQGMGLPQGSSLGPAAGYLPDTYSKEHQRSLSTQLPQAAPPPAQPYPFLGPEPRSNSAGSNIARTSMPFPEPERPGTRNCFYPPSSLAQQQQQQPSAPALNQHNNGRVSAQGMYYASPTPHEQIATHPPLQSQQPTTNLQRHGTSSFSGTESFSTMQTSPIISMPARLPTKARDAIYCQYTPRSVSWDGRDIQESVMDATMGRRILNRYALGMAREKYVREGFYIKEKSPSFADSQTAQQKQRPPQQRQLQRQFTMDRDGNDRVILKYLKSKRDWEIDCVMMRYLTCQHPEERLESQYMDYPQPQQHCQNVNPFVVGLYETFMHPHGNDYEGCRYLSVLQWFPETLNGYIEDSIASGEGLEVTLPIVRTLIECVDWLHERKICHLNIKPSNFVRDPYAASSIRRLGGGIGWKLVDFEAARIMDEEFVGRCTFSYAAPEILVGNAASVGVVAKGSLDIWSLGLVIYELLTDKPLFKTDDQARNALLPGDASPSRSEIRPVRYYDCKNISPEYHPLLDAMLAHDPEKRPTAAQLLRMDLFTTPITPRPVSQDQLIRNNNILSLRDLKAARLCNLSGGTYKTLDQAEQQRRGALSSNVSVDSAHGNGAPQQQQMILLEGIGRILDSPFDQVPRLFMLLPPMNQDMDASRPFMPTNLFQNKSMRLVLLCEGLSGYGEDAHVTDHRGYVLQDLAAFVQDLGKMLLHLVAVAGTNNPGYETPALDRPLTLTGTPLDNCQRWYPSLRSYYETLQAAIQRQVGPAPSPNELRSLRGPNLKSLDQWLVRLVRQQYQTSALAALTRKPTVVAVRDTAGFGRSGPGATGYDDLSEQFATTNLNEEPDLPDVTGPGGGEGYGGLYKMPVGTCGDRWICRGCVSKQRAMSADMTLSATGSVTGSESSAS
ncbi:hypothetical protein BGZ75_000140 [Mortierella antarctica]|nr:hypothetical protein BGZ75_000140 [Mortierella antarctica]